VKNKSRKLFPAYGHSSLPGGRTKKELQSARSLLETRKPCHLQPENHAFVLRHGKATTSSTEASSRRISKT
jgi:hypothetical protein